MRFEMSPFTILLIIAVILFVLAAFGVALGTVSPIPLGLALFAAAFLFGGGGRGLDLRR